MLKSLSVIKRLLLLCSSGDAPLYRSFLERSVLIFAFLLIISNIQYISGQDLTINPTFAANITAAQRTVIQQAIAEWHAVIRTRGINPENLALTFQNGNVNPSLAVTNGGNFDVNTGAVLATTITFDNSGAFFWFIDPTPGNITDDNIPVQPCPPPGVGVPPCPQFDYLSVARHEIGHALGFFIPDTRPPANNTQSPAVNPFINAGFTTFDQGRLNIGITPQGGGHTTAASHPNDIMNPLFAPGQQRAISLYPAASFIARAYQLSISMKFVDRNFTGVPDGTVTRPFNKIRDGFVLLPGVRSMLLIPGNYDFLGATLPFDVQDRMTIMAARGGNASVPIP